MSRIKTTSGQRKKLYQRHNGVGFIAYKVGENVTCEVEFYVDPKGQLCYVSNGAPLCMEVEDEDGQVRGIQIISAFREEEVRSPPP